MDKIKLRGHHLRILAFYLKMRSYGKRTNKEEFKNFIDERAVDTAIHAGHSKKHGLNVSKLIREIIEEDVKVKFTDTLDDICETCNDKRKKECKEFIKYGLSAACGDRVTLYVCGFKKNKTYTSKYIIRKLKKLKKEKGWEWWA